MQTKLVGGNSMQYFTDELWTNINSEDNNTKLMAQEQWNRNVEAYMIRFRSLKSRFSKKTYDIFSKKSFHDYRLKDIRICHKESGNTNPITVIVVLTNKEEVWTVTYKKVSKIAINYVEKKTFRNYQRGFDDLGYTELLDIDKDTLSHEILFASGAIFMVQFANKNVFVDNTTA